MVRSAVRMASVNLRTGARINYAESGNPHGEPIVLVHGWPDSWFSFSRVLPLLPGALRALAIDQRGFGDSSRPEAGYTIPEMAADVAAFLDAVDLPRATLVGHSFGSFVARRTALAFPQRVTSLVLIGTGFSSSNPVTQDVQTAMRDLPDPIPEQFARDFQTSTAYLPLPPEFFDRIIAESLKLPPRLWRLTFDRLLEYDDVNRLAEIAAPTLLLWGDHDGLFPRSDQERVHATIAGSRLTVYEETGHCPNWERPELVAADIAAFVADR
jgi:pimeloyl-ACP methyl ester carboxylesterase